MEKRKERGEEKIERGKEKGEEWKREREIKGKRNRAWPVAGCVKPLHISPAPSSPSLTHP